MVVTMEQCVTPADFSHVRNFERALDLYVKRLCSVKKRSLKINMLRPEDNNIIEKKKLLHLSKNLRSGFASV